MPLKQIYRGPKDRPSSEQVQDWLDSPPPWRDHADQEPVDRPVPPDPAAARRGETYVSSSDREIERVNLALWLRRPLLVTGPPGIGKSSLAYGIATALGLGAPLRWEINSHSTLHDGLYTYDAVAHFQAARASGGDGVPASAFVRLGPLGTAFAPTHRPRVVLVDELDKAAWDLPNDLLHVFEEGAFTIPEIARQSEPARVQLHDSTSPDDRLLLADARVRVRHHPVVVITSNGEREFSQAFLRRCVTLHMEMLSPERMAEVVRSQLGNTSDVESRLTEMDGLPTDVVLQVLYAIRHGADLPSVLTTLDRS